MNKFIGILLILLMTSVSADARTLSSDTIKTEVAKQVVQLCKKYTDAQIQASVIALPFASLEVPEGKVEYTVTSLQDRFAARDLKKVVISVNGRAVKSFNVPVVIQAYKEVLVATTFIDRDKSITRMVAAPKRIEVADRLEFALTADMFDKEMITRKVFREGEILDRRFVKLRPDVVRNSTVEAFFNTNDLMISIQATALGEGMVGDYVTIQNRNYGRTYTGKIIGENKVLVNI